MLGNAQRIFGVVCLSLVVIGCSGGDTQRPKTVQVSGVVTYAGTPVDQAEVTFVKDGISRFPSGTTDSNGKYQLTTFDKNDGAVVGTYSVTVTKIEATGPKTQEDLAKGMPMTPPKSLVPEKYMDVKTTPLKDIVVKDGRNEIELKLED